MVENAEGVPAKGSVGLAVLERGLLSGLSAFGPLLGCGGFKWVVINVLHWGGEVPEEGWRVERVIAMGLV